MKLCLTLAESSRSRLQHKISSYSSKVPYVEVRLDHLEEIGIPTLPRHSSTEFIATCRPQREGGRFSGSETQRLEILRSAARAGFRWLDLEHDVEDPGPLPEGTGVIRSRHCFDRFPEDLSRLYRETESLRGTVTKLAVSVSTTQELVTLLRWMESASPAERRIVLGMGRPGQASRYLGAFLGNYWTYVTEQPASPAAPGQFSLAEAADCYRDLAAESRPAIFGVLGNPILHSLSPPLHNRLFSDYRLPNVYLPIEVDSVETWFDYVRGSHLPFRGFSVTLPFKTSVARLLDRVESPVDSINTLCRDEVGWLGRNTDFQGFLRPLRSCLELHGRRALVIGNGGVAHTVVAALKSEGAAPVIVGRNPERVSAFARLHQCPYVSFDQLPIQADLVVNTTPLGQFPNLDRSPLAETQLAGELVYDLVYHPEETLLLRLARRRQMKVISGLEMFVEQAAEQFRLWTGIEASRPRMRQIVREALSERLPDP